MPSKILRSKRTNETKDKPPNKDTVDTITTSIPTNDTQSKQRMGIWDRLTQSFLCPPRTALCSGCLATLGDIQEE